MSWKSLEKIIPIFMLDRPVEMRQDQPPYTSCLIILEFQTGVTIRFSRLPADLALNQSPYMMAPTIPFDEVLGRGRLQALQWSFSSRHNPLACLARKVPLLKFTSCTPTASFVLH